MIYILLSLVVLLLIIVILVSKILIEYCIDFERRIKEFVDVIEKNFNAVANNQCKINENLIKSEKSSDRIKDICNDNSKKIHGNNANIKIIKDDIKVIKKISQQIAENNKAKSSSMMD